MTKRVINGILETMETVFAPDNTLTYSSSVFFSLSLGLLRRILNTTSCLMMWNLGGYRGGLDHPSRQALSTNWWRDSPTTSMPVRQCTGRQLDNCIVLMPDQAVSLRW